MVPVQAQHQNLERYPICVLGGALFLRTDVCREATHADATRPADEDL